MDDLGKAAKDWPEINFVIYHSAYRFAGGGTAEQGLEQFGRTGRVEWTSDLAEIPEKYGVTNVYGDLGQIFAQTTVVQPRLAAALMGILVKGLGADHVVWGTDAVWTGSPQWQIEALRRLEIPEDMQRQFGFAPLGPADGPVKTAIFAGNSVRMYKYERAPRRSGHRPVSRVKRDYAAAGGERSNLAYGYVAAGWNGFPGRPTDGPLLQLQPRRPYHRAPFVQFGPDQRRELRAVLQPDGGARPPDALRGLRLLGDAEDRRRKPLAERWRQSGRTDEAEPHIDLDISAAPPPARSARRATPGRAPAPSPPAPAACPPAPAAGRSARLSTVQSTRPPIRSASPGALPR